MQSTERVTRHLIVTTFVIAAFAGDARAQERAPATEEQEAPKVEYSWKDGETRFRFPGGEMTLSNRVQFRWMDTRREGRIAEQDFDMPRARTKLDGWFYSKHLTYEMQWDFAEGPELQDLFLSWDISRKKALELQVGQFKVPFGRQRLTSSGSQQFVDRSIVSREFTKGRDIGVQVKGLLADKRIEYRAGVFNGAGQNTLRDENRGRQYNGRVMFQPFGAVKYSEGDFESTDSPLLAVAGNFEVNDRHRAAAGSNRKRAIVGADVVFKYLGLSINGEAFHRRLNPEQGSPFRSNGVQLQAGYLIVPRRLEVGGRFATWDPTSLVPSDDRRELGLVVGYFHNRHNLKLQTDVRRLEDTQRNRTDHEVRAQLQIIF